MFRKTFHSDKSSFKRMQFHNCILLFICCGIFLLINFTSSTAAFSAEITALRAGELIERELSANRSDQFQLTASAGQFIQIKIEQQGIKVVLSLSDQEGNLIGEAARMNNGRKGVFLLSAIAEQRTTYQITVRPSDPQAPIGRYQIILSQRDRQSDDEHRVLAERAFEAGRKLYNQATQQSRQQAIEKFQTALSSWRKIADRNGEADTLQALGLASRAYGDLPQAKDYYEQALSLQQQLGDRRGENITFLSLGLTYHILGNFQKALEYYQQSLAWWQIDNDKVNEALAFNNLGGLYDSIGELQNALDFYQRALQLERAQGNQVAEARALSNMGISYDKLGNTQQALDCYQQALTIFRQFKDSQKEALTLGNIGYIFASLSDSQKALEYYQQALEVGKDSVNPHDKAPIIANIGAVYEVAGDYKKALEFYNQALKIQQSVNQLYGMGYTLINIGHLQFISGETTKSRETYLQALAIFQQISDTQGEASVLQKLGELAAASKDQPAALQYYQQALTRWRDIRDQRGEATTLYDIARAETAQKNLTDARNHINQAIELVESLRGKVANQTLRSIYFGSVRSHYDLAINLLMELHQRQPDEHFDIAAFELSERARARSLLELLIESNAEIRRDVDQRLIARERILQEKLNLLSTQLQSLKGRDKDEHREIADQRAVLGKEISALLTQYQQVETEIKTSSPRYAALTQPQPFKLKEVQQLLDDETMLLEYTLIEEHCYLWAVTRDSLRGFELPDSAEIEALSRQTYELMVARNQTKNGESVEQRLMRWQQADREFPITAKRLSRILLGPIAGQLGNRRLLIVADGALQYLPFAVLPIPANQNVTLAQPLLSEHEIVNLPSASTLLVLRQELQGRKPAANTLAILADPVFAKDDPRLQASGKKEVEIAAAQLASRSQQRAIEEAGVTDGFTMPRLLYTRREAEAIISIAGNSRVKKALDFEANHTIATSEELSQYQVVHFATHALFNNKHPELSAIVLSLYNETGQSENGFLQLNEIYNLKLPAELIVLSACQTGLGKEIRGEGLIGLTRGFMYAGAARVIASLWKIDDVATAELMKRFYQHMLIEKESPAASLRHAQLEMQRQPRWQSPFYWAAFVLQGEFK